MFDYIDVFMYEKYNAENEIRRDINKAIKTFQYFKYRKLYRVFNKKLSIIDFIKDFINLKRQNAC